MYAHSLGGSTLQSVECCHLENVHTYHIIAVIVLLNINQVVLTHPDTLIRFLTMNQKHWCQRVINIEVHYLQAPQSPDGPSRSLKVIIFWRS